MSRLLSKPRSKRTRKTIRSIALRQIEVALIDRIGKKAKECVRYKAMINGKVKPLRPVSKLQLYMALTIVRGKSGKIEWIFLSFCAIIYIRYYHFLILIIKS